MSSSFKEIIRVLFHENGGFTKVLIERFVNIGLANGGKEISIPTEKIPPNLRKIGSRFILTGNYEDINSLKVECIK